MRTGENLVIVLLLIAGLFLFYLALALRADQPRVTITARQDAIECQVRPDSLNRWLDIVVEDVTGEGYDLTEQNRTIYTLDLPKLLSCPVSDGVDVAPGLVRAACELQWFDLINGKMRVESAKTTLVCQR